MTQQGIYYPEEKTKLFQHHLGNLSYVNKQASVACFHMPYPFKAEFERDVYDACQNYNRVIILVTELHPSTVAFVRKYDKPNISYFFCGRLNQHLNHAQEHEFLDWFINTVYFYKELRPNVLNTLTPYSEKPFYFDALLGRIKPHRSQVWHYLEQNLKGQGIATYIGNNYCDFGKQDSNKWIWEKDGLEIDKVPEWTVGQMIYHGHPISLSQIVPISIYNQSAYSLVAETNYEDDYVFFTEKTVKPILGRRLFLMAAHQHSLAALRELGFQTFGSIIDESYDTVADYETRNKLMLEQLSWLCNQDQKEILARAKHIVDHNYVHLMTTDWYGRFLKGFAPYFV